MWGELGVNLRNCILYSGMAVLDYLVETCAIRREMARLGSFRYFPA